MNADEIWKQLIAKRPQLREPGAKIEITAANLRALIRQVWDQGHQHGPTSTDAFGRLREMFKDPM